VAVVVSIARGHDASYPFKTIGAVEGPVITGERGAGYYLSAVEKGGEPAGIWIGNGAAELGFRDGDVVRREDFEPLYGQFLDPRDPSGQTYLGSPPRVNAELAALYQAKLAAHPGATAGERMRLLTEARTEYEGPVGVQYFDTTFSVDKTISLAHPSALASAIEARQAGDLEPAGEWEARAAGIWAEIETSVRQYVGHMQREAGFVRTGHHGRRIGGVEAGRFEDAREIPVAIFPQHTSRNGDPQLHVHVLWLNKVQTVSDGQWRAIDSRGLHRNKGAGSALAAFALETGLTRRFGFEWAYRPASKGRVIAGVPEKAIQQFSSRRTQITKDTQALVEQYERDRGHAPDQRAVSSMRQFANARTRRGKDAGALDFTALLREWEATSRCAELGTLRAACVTRGTHARARTRGHAAGLAHAQEARAACTRADLVHCIGQHLPDHATGRDQEHAWQLLNDLTTRALDGQAGEDVLRLDTPEWPRVPDTLRRADGESIYRPHGAELYATRAQLSMEQQLLAEAQAEGAPHLPREDAVRLLGADLAQLEAQLRADAPAPDGATKGGLRVDQATAAFVALTSLRRAELIVGPAGTGKTYTAVRIADAWRTAGRGQVIGIAATSAGRNVLLEAGIPVAEEHSPVPRPPARPARSPRSNRHRPGRAGDPGRGQHHLHARPRRRHPPCHPVRGQAAHPRGPRPARRRVLGRGDGDAGPQARPRPAHRGRPVPQRLGKHRVPGHPRRGRVRARHLRRPRPAARRQLRADGRAGLPRLPHRVPGRHRRRADRVRAPRMRRPVPPHPGIPARLGPAPAQPGPTTALRDSAQAYTGDLIVARQNDNHLEAGEPGRTLANGDLLRVEAIGARKLTVSRLIRTGRAASQRTWSAPFTLSTEYAAASCDLGYALTWYTVEGQTVSVGIALANDQRAREGLYVAIPRGQQRNEVYAYPPPRSQPRASSASHPAQTPRSPASARSRPTATAPAGRLPWTARTRLPSWPPPSAATTQTCQPPRPASRHCRTPTTSAPCTRSGRTNVVPKHMAGTRRRHATTPPRPMRRRSLRTPTRCGAPCALRSWPAGTAAR
jgi:hypothetical protein